MNSMLRTRLITFSATILVVLCIGGLFVSKARHLQFYSVDSSLMSPILTSGDLFIGHKTTPKELKSGDIVAYRIADGEIKMSRIRAINQINGNVVLVADNQLDSQITAQSSNILATRSANIPLLGYLLAEIRQPMVLIGLFYIPILWLVYRESRRLLRHYWRRPYRLV